MKIKSIISNNPKRIRTPVFAKRIKNKPQNPTARKAIQLVLQELFYVAKSLTVLKNLYKSCAVVKSIKNRVNLLMREAGMVVNF